MEKLRALEVELERKHGCRVLIIQVNCYQYHHCHHPHQHHHQHHHRHPHHHQHGGAQMCIGRLHRRLSASSHCPKAERGEGGGEKIVIVIIIICAIFTNLVVVIIIVIIISLILNNLGTINVVIIVIRMLVNKSSPPFQSSPKSSLSSIICKGWCACQQRWHFGSRLDLIL